MPSITIDSTQIKAARAVHAYGFVTFAEAYNLLADQDRVIDMQEGEQAVGYYGNLVKKDLGIKPGDRVAFLDDFNRPVIVTGTVFGNCITFKRHTDVDGYVLVSNVPDELSSLLAGGNLSHDEHAVSLLVADQGGENIGSILERLTESLISKRRMTLTNDLFDGKMKVTGKETPAAPTLVTGDIQHTNQFEDPTTLEQVTLDQAIATVVRDDMLVIDGHGTGKDVESIIGLIEFAFKGKLFICPAFKNHFCLNPLQFSAEPMSQLAINPWSIGGVLDARTVLLPTAIKHYKGNGLITRYWTVDSGIVEHVVDAK